MGHGQANPLLLWSHARLRTVAARLRRSNHMIHGKQTEEATRRANWTIERSLVSQLLPATQMTPVQAQTPWRVPGKTSARPSQGGFQQRRIHSDDVRHASTNSSSACT